MKGKTEKKTKGKTGEGQSRNTKWQPIERNKIIFLSYPAVLSLLLILLFLIHNLGEAKKEKWYYPEGYRNWYHVKSMVIEPGHPLYKAFGGIHHVYANKKALEGLKKGKFEDGAVLVFDLLEAVKKENTIQEGKRKVLAYMRKNSKMRETGGWEFKAFAEGNREKQVVKNPKAECFSCHTKAKATDYVFSKIRE